MGRIRRLSSIVEFQLLLLPLSAMLLECSLRQLKQGHRTLQPLLLLLTLLCRVLVGL